MSVLSFIREEAKGVATRAVRRAINSSVAVRLRTVKKAFEQPTLLETPRKASIVFAHDWGSDGAGANVVHQMRLIGQTTNTDLTVTEVLGIPPLGSPLIAALEFNRIIDTHIRTLETCVRVDETNGLSKEEIQRRLSHLVLVNVFDLSVGTDRVAALVEGTLTIRGNKNDYKISVGLVGPINNGIIGSLLHRLDSVVGFDLSNSKYHVDNQECVTWDGRARFGPVAAFYASGVSASAFGKPIEATRYPRIVYEPIFEGGSFFVPLVDIDPIGNLVLGLPNDQANKLLSAPFVSFELQGSSIKSYLAQSGAKFSDVAVGQAVAYMGSNGLLELTLNRSGPTDRTIAEIFNLSRENLSLDVHGLELTPKTFFALKPAQDRSFLQASLVVN